MTLRTCDLCGHPIEKWQKSIMDGYRGEVHRNPADHKATVIPVEEHLPGVNDVIEDLERMATPKPKVVQPAPPPKREAGGFLGRFGL